MTEIISDRIPRWTIEQPAGRVRWLRRGGQKVLQQYWSITTYQQVIDVTQVSGQHGEWRDVPIEEDDGQTSDG
jgi:hypothetical protein